MASNPSTHTRGLRQPAQPTFPNIILVHLSADGRIIARLYVMGGTIAETSVGQVSLSGLAALLHTTQTTLRTD